MLNGAYAVGIPGCVFHLAEEIPRLRTNVPTAIGAQVVVGLVTAFFYLIALFYLTRDLDSALGNPHAFPLVEVYLQATNSRGGSLGLLMVIFYPTICTYITLGRMLWTLTRDDATPFSKFTGCISPTHKNPFNATLACRVVCTMLGCIYVGSFVVLSTLSYLAAILPHMLSRRACVIPGPFWMLTLVAYTILGISCAYIVAFVVIYCFPYSLPVTAQNMNYSCLITGGLAIFVGIL
jgi:choline transport protein